MTMNARYLLAVLLGTLCLWVNAGARADEHTVECSIKVAGAERTYRLHVPPRYSREKAAPLVFAFHGGGQNARVAERFTHLSELSDREGFLVVYPDALFKNWNDGRNDPMLRSQREKVDDLGFIGALLDEISDQFNIDPKRIFATGPSNGGIFSNLVGARMSDRFAAIAPVIGGMAPSVAGSFDPKSPISVLMINGTEDPLVPFEGGKVTFMGRGRGNIIPTADTVKNWVRHNGCQPAPQCFDLPDKDAGDETRTKVAVYSGGRKGTEVVVYTIEGGGHAWPGGRQYLPESMVGRVCKDFNATDVIWEFFSRHPRGG